MKKENIIHILVMFMFLASSLHVVGETNDVLSQIDKMTTDAGKEDRSVGEAIALGIETDPLKVSKALVNKLNDKRLTEQQQAVYIWALGLAKDETTVEVIKNLYNQNSSDLVRNNCLCALASIGGRRAEEFLVASLDATKDKEKRFAILNLLGQMQCEAALPKMEEILEKDPEKFYWQSIFVFGKMGDKSVPFLLRKIDDKNINVRTNVIIVLGKWLIPPEATQPLQNLFVKEKNTGLRVMILGSLESTITDLEHLKVFFNHVLEREKDKDVVKFAQETIDNMDKLKTDLANFSKKKQPSAESFQREYEALLKSGGKKGSYEVLGTSSTAQDESKLKTLRERILQRNSDEAFYDYQKINTIIFKNRMIQK